MTRTTEEVTFHGESRLGHLSGCDESAASGNEVEENNKVDLSILSHGSDLTPTKPFHHEGDNILLLETEITSTSLPADVPSTADSSKATQQSSTSIPQPLTQESE